MKKHILNALFASTSLVVSSAFVSAFAAAAPPAFDADDIGGVVSSAAGPEAGVWVIAETSDLSTPYTKIVITDDQGRYVLPDLPKAAYKVWVRGYGLKDSKPVEGAVGKVVNLAVVTEIDPKAAAQIYPAQYWESLIKPPEAAEFPGTGPQGNGIAPAMVNQQAWMSHFKEQCHYCHQLGNKATREGATTVEAWAERINKARAPGDHVLADHGSRYSLIMNNNMTRFGRTRALQMYADWSARIEAGEVPKEKPPRPAGVERNLVLTMWDWADGHYIHDEATSDKRNPTVNAKGPTYGVTTLQGYLAVLDPVSHGTDLVPVPDLDPAVKRITQDVTVHNPMVDGKKRVWMTIQGAASTPPAECSNGDKNKYAKYFPNITGKESKRIAVYDPADKQMRTVPVCFGNHHLAFGYDKDDTVYFSGDTNVIGWVNTRVFDETKDSLKAMGWCPMVLDTNGDGKIDADRASWNQPSGTDVTAGDAKKDTRISGFIYGLNTNPVDDSVWGAKYVPSLPSGIVRMSPGKSPPETCVTEYYEPTKKADGNYIAYGARGLDFDSKGVAWVGFASGQLGRFERAKCKTVNGAKALGQQCPEGWSVYNSPGPKVAGQTMGSADFHYLAWIDVHDTFGLGKDTPIMPGSNSDSLIAFQKDQQKFVVLRVPYPLGFYTRGMDGRIDDTKAGWKGKGLWATYGEAPVWHQEDGEGASSKMIQFQYRPDPLAH